MVTNISALLVDLQALSQFELRQICYFLAVVQAGNNFTKAADRLGIQQPPVSQRIKALEALLSSKSEPGSLLESWEVKLFDRSTSPITLTPAGEVFLEDVTRAIGHLDRAVSRARQASQGHIGRLSIGVTNVIANSLLPEIVQCFQPRFPNVTLEFYEVPILKQLQMLRRHELDLAFQKPDDEDTEPENILQTDSAKTDSDLIFKPILEEYFLLAVAVQHPLALLPAIPLTALKNEPILLPSLELFPFYAKVLALCKTAGFTPNLAPNIHATGVVTLLSLVAAGVGVSVLPNHVQALQRQGVVYRPIQGFDLTRTVAAVWRRGDRSLVLRQFLKVVEEMTQMTLLDSW